MFPSVWKPQAVFGAVMDRNVGISCRSCWTMKWTVMKSGKRRSQVKASPIVKR